MCKETLSKEEVLKYFEAISNIPRKSGNEKQISDYFVNIAKNKGLKVFQDDYYNVIIKIPATKGLEDAPTVILQGHLDMVCEKNKGVEHDFNKDPLKLKVEGDMLYATDTTLGADDGIALVYALALMDKGNVSHPNIEILLTTEEETSMNGINVVDEKLLDGKILINIDSEEEGKLLVSSAGGIDIDIIIPIKWEELNENMNAYKVNIKGLNGGHSGMAIDKGRANSNKLMGRMLRYLENKGISYHLHNACGGSKVNAIPREAEVIILSNEKEEVIKNDLKEIETVFKKEFKVADKNIHVDVAKLDEKIRKVFSKETLNKLIQAIMLIPNGIETMSMDIEGLVESSNNIGIIRSDNENIYIESEIRSAVGSLKWNLVEKIKVLCELLNCNVETKLEYLEWTYDPNSRIRELCKDVYKENFGEYPEIIACHAGIECSILINKIPSLDAISIGPNTYEVHNPDEHVSISSVIRTWDYLRNILKEMKRY